MLVHVDLQLAPSFDVFTESGERTIYSTCFIRVINGIQTSDIRNLFNPENVFISKEGGGAGNNWASGFTQGEQVQETLLDMIGMAFSVTSAHGIEISWGDSQLCSLVPLILQNCQY
jgi:hypothetical protein